MSGTDRGGGGGAQAVKWRRRMAASSSSPHSVNLLSLSLPPNTQINLTYPRNIHTLEHSLPLYSEWLSLERLSEHVRGLCRTCPHRLWCLCQRTHLGLGVGAALSQGWAVFRVTSLTTPIKPLCLGMVAVYACPGAAHDLRARLWPEAIKPRGRGEEQVRVFRMQGKSTRRTLCLRGAI